jgi:SPP1 gp7 family putative phage head morphogenesis protein
VAKTKPPTDPGAFKEAVDWFRARVPIQKEKWLELTDTARRKASTIAGVAQVDIIGDVMKDLEHALTKGETLEDFRRRAIDKLTEAWGGKDIPGRIETIFRTNVQMAHSHGRREQMVTPSMLKIRPYWRFVSLLDMRTTQFCRPLNGVTLPATDVFWNRHTPPLHFNCRSMLMSLRSSIAEEEGITEKPPKIEAMEGFGVSTRFPSSQT